MICFESAVLTHIVVTEARYGVEEVCTEVGQLCGSWSSHTIQITALEQFLHPLLKQRIHNVLYYVRSRTPL